MRRPPSFRRIFQFPATAGTGLLAIALTFAWWSGTNMSPLIVDPRAAHGELWRLLTTTLLHADPFHLAFNLYWLWVFGSLLEENFGWPRTLAIYGYLALGSGAAELTLLRGGVGLSGVGYGLFGLMWVLDKRGTARGDDRFADTIDEKTITLFGAWFAFCVITTYTGLYAVANIAHATGTLLGALLGWSITQCTARGEDLQPVLSVEPNEAKKHGLQTRATLNCFAAPTAVLIALLLAVTVLRPHLNISPVRGAEEGQIGYEALTAGDHQSAVHWLRDATTMQPTTAVYWFDLAIAEAHLNRHRAALDAYKRAADLDPQNVKYQSAFNDMNDFVARTRS